jgi:hypothetical protein
MLIDWIYTINQSSSCNNFRLNFHYITIIFQYIFLYDLHIWIATDLPLSYSLFFKPLFCAYKNSQYLFLIFLSWFSKYHFYIFYNYLINIYSFIFFLLFISIWIILFNNEIIQYILFLLIYIITYFFIYFYFKMSTYNNIIHDKFNHDFFGFLFHLLIFLF